MGLQLKFAISRLCMDQFGVARRPVFMHVAAAEVKTMGVRRHRRPRPPEAVSDGFGQTLRGSGGSRRGCCVGIGHLVVQPSLDMSLRTGWLAPPFSYH